MWTIAEKAKAAVATAPCKSAPARRDAKNYGADILQMMAHAKKVEGHSITRTDAHGSLNPLGIGSIVMPYLARPALRDRPCARMHACGLQGACPF